MRFDVSKPWVDFYRHIHHHDFKLYRLFLLEEKLKLGTLHLKWWASPTQRQAKRLSREKRESKHFHCNCKCLGDEMRSIICKSRIIIWKKGGRKITVDYLQLYYSNSNYFFPSCTIWGRMWIFNWKRAQQILRHGNSLRAPSYNTLCSFVVPLVE